jgi:FHA domain
MTDDKPAKANPAAAAGGSIPNRLLGSLREALAAASRDATGEITVGERTEILPKDQPQGAKAAGQAQPPPPPAAAPNPPTAQLTAAEAVREAKAATRGHFEAEPTSPVARGKGGAAGPIAAGPARTQVVRGKPKVARASFEQDPIVGWLVVVGGPGLGAYRPIFEGNNAVGRGSDQRIAIDFGDNTISSTEQAYIRYDSMDRSFLFVPNLSKTNVVAVNNKRPTGAVKLEHMDVITMGRTQLAFVPFCGEEFDWSELSGLEE